MALKFFKFVPASLIEVDKSVLENVDNPGAVITFDQKMVVQSENTTLQLSEIQTITELISKIK